MIITPFQTNPSQTVGLAETSGDKLPVIERSLNIGIFNPAYLKEWTEKIIATFGTEQVTLMILTSGTSNKATCLIAVENLDETLAVAVSGIGED